MLTNKKNTWWKNSDEGWHIGEHRETQGRAFLKRHFHVCFFFSLNVYLFFLVPKISSETRSLLTPCTFTPRSRRTMLSSKPLIDMKPAGQLWLNQWVWQASTLAPSIFLLSADPLETTSSSNKYHWHCSWSGLQRWVWLEAKLPHVRSSTERKRMLCPSLPAWPAWPTTRKQTKCTDETLPLKIPFNFWPCKKGCWNDFFEFRLLNIRNNKGIKMPWGR